MKRRIKFENISQESPAEFYKEVQPGHLGDEGDLMTPQDMKINPQERRYKRRRRFL